MPSSPSSEDDLNRLKEALITRVKARIWNDTDNAVCAAIRLLICNDLGVRNEVDGRKLLVLQEEDGSFGKGTYVRYGGCGIKIAHPGFACVLAAEALRGWDGEGRGMK